MEPNCKEKARIDYFIYVKQMCKRVMADCFTRIIRFLFFSIPICILLIHNRQS